MKGVFDPQRGVTHRLRTTALFQFLWAHLLILFFYHELTCTTQSCALGTISFQSFVFKYTLFLLTQFWILQPLKQNKTIVVPCNMNIRCEKIKACDQDLKLPCDLDIANIPAPAPSSHSLAAVTLPRAPSEVKERWSTLQNHLTQTHECHSCTCIATNRPRQSITDI